VRNYVIALYIRLSVEDFKTESLSIPNQKLILREKAMSLPEWDNSEILEFIDNGHTGTNFERPAVQELLTMVQAGIIMTVLSPLLSLFYSTANGGQTWTFDYFMQQVMISNCTLFFPIIIALIAGYIITREYTDDTMKNISTIPISYKQLLSGKLLVLLLLTICFSGSSCGSYGSHSSRRSVFCIPELH
jgi:hypothetical protein